VSFRQNEPDGFVAMVPNTSASEGRWRAVRQPPGTTGSDGSAFSDGRTSIGGTTRFLMQLH
jgi:hypothetical protein